MTRPFIKPAYNASRSRIGKWHISVLNNSNISCMGLKYYINTSYSDLGSKYVSFLRNNKSRYPSAYSSIGFIKGDRK